MFWTIYIEPRLSDRNLETFAVFFGIYCRYSKGQKGITVFAPPPSLYRATKPKQSKGQPGGLHFYKQFRWELFARNEESCKTALRYCPARWIRLKVCSFDRSLWKEGLWRFFRKIPPSPIEWEPFKAMAPSHTVIAHYALNGQMCSKAHIALTAPLVLHHTWIYKRAVKKSLSMAKCGINLFLLSSIILHCKSRYECWECL